ALLNANIATSYSNLRLMSADGAQFNWGWQQDAGDLACVLWPIVWSAAELLTTGDLARVRMCQHEHCGWIFIDRSKNRSRRWCDMTECGNVEKVRRYRRKQKT
ncbi:MAG: CGNR zinc finger domain-containing protein, partial [Caldilinea sp.]